MCLPACKVGCKTLSLQPSPADLFARDGEVTLSGDRVLFRATSPSTLSPVAAILAPLWNIHRCPPFSSGRRRLLSKPRSIKRKRLIWIRRRFVF